MHQPVMFHINQETVMPQKISTNDGVLNISNDKHPLKGAKEFNVRSRLPYVAIVVLLTACRKRLDLQGLLPETEGGMTLTSAPVSTTKRNPVALSVRYNR